MPMIGNETSHRSRSIKSQFRNNFPEVEKPTDEDIPKMPIRITSLSTVSLGDLLSKYSAWREYADDMAAVAASELLIKMEEYTHERAKASLLIDGKIGEKKLALDADESLYALWQEVLERQVYNDLLAKKVENLTNCITTISREISRRGQMNERS